MHMNPSIYHSGSPRCLQVDLTLNLTPRKTRGLSAGGGISAKDRANGLTGFIGSASFSQRNLFGLNQKLSVTLEAGQVCALHIPVHMLGCRDTNVLGASGMN